MSAIILPEILIAPAELFLIGILRWISFSRMLLLDIFSSNLFQQYYISVGFLAAGSRLRVTSARFLLSMPIFTALFTKDLSRVHSLSYDFLISKSCETKLIGIPGRHRSSVPPSLSRIPHASEITHCMTNSGIVREIFYYVEYAEEVPYAQPVPYFTVVRNKRGIRNFIEMGETFKHIPAWLPAFRDPHTYIHSAVWNERVTDPRDDKIQLARQRRKAERSLLSLQQRDQNLIEISIHSLSQPERKMFHQFFRPPNYRIKSTQVPLMETFAPAIEALEGGYCKSGDGGDISLPDKRPAV
ncbi:unnamed protein product [Ilex paraguariensis]|uniref:Transcription initiation factor TFIID subunit 8 n=1 Tax=Ilex paraguariensis TaxID=185542 RepID=A0ABC8UNL6_9AQUA